MATSAAHGALTRSEIEFQIGFGDSFESDGDDSAALVRLPQLYLRAIDTQQFAGKSFALVSALVRRITSYNVCYTKLLRIVGDDLLPLFAQCIGQSQG